MRFKKMASITVEKLVLTVIQKVQLDAVMPDVDVTTKLT
jgi:hypothetical protein